MKKALVLGATGGMGYAIVHELIQRGVEVTAFSRNQRKLERLFADVRNKNQVRLHPGDAFYTEQLEAAAQGVDVIFHAVSLPYFEWEEKLRLMMDRVLQASKRQEAKLAVVDNIYAYGRHTGERIKEDTPKIPQTKKGKLRLEVERMAKSEAIPVLFTHFPDFYGPNATNTMLHYMIQWIVQNKASNFVGSLQVPREYLFTPDGAKAIVELAFRDDAYNQNWNIPGYELITGEELIRIIKEITGYSKSVRSIGGGMIRFLGLFNRQMREMVEMLYLTRETIALSGEKYETNIGPLPRTPYRDGLRQTIEWIRKRSV